MSPHSPPPPVRKRLRLPRYDYSSSGAYFVTFCTLDRRCVLGTVRGATVHLSPIGQIVADAWRAIPHRSPWIRLDAYVLMPNHIHGILEIGSEDMPESARGFPRPSLPAIVGWFKKRSTTAVNQLTRNRGCPLWQRGYYEHIIRSERSCAAIRAYIDANPAEWRRDSLNPERPGGRSPPLRIPS